MSLLEHKIVDLAKTRPGDPLNYFLGADVPLSFLLDCGTISLTFLLEKWTKHVEDEFRIVMREEDGELVVQTTTTPIAFLQSAFHAGLAPWGASDGDDQRLSFYNAVPFVQGNVVWFSMDGCTNEDSIVPLCLPPDELKRELRKEKRREQRVLKKVEAEREARRPKVVPVPKEAIDEELIKMEGVLEKLYEERGIDSPRKSCPDLWGHIAEVEAVLECLDGEFDHLKSEINIDRVHHLVMASASLMDRLAVEAGVR